MLNSIFKCFVTSVILFCCTYANADVYEKLSAKPLFNNLGGVIWGMTFINNNELLISLKSGEIKHLNLKQQTVTSVARVDVLYEGQGGLLDIALSPNFKEEKSVYITYVKDINGQGATTLAKALWNGKVLSSFEDILVTKSSTDTSRHFGSRIAFDSKHIYFTIGDRGVRPNSQNLSNHAGSTIRLNIDGSIPKDNPFVGQKEMLNEIYSYGHRNAQGLFYDKQSDKLFSVEHGPRGGDEINLVEKGLNYGWPVISYGKEYWNPFPVGEGTHKEGMEQPIKVYTPSIAPSNLVVYRGNKYERLKDKILVGALKLRHINLISMNQSFQAIKETRLFEGLNERIRCIAISPDQFIYFSTDSGSIYKVIEN